LRSWGAKGTSIGGIPPSGDRRSTTDVFSLAAHELTQPLASAIGSIRLLQEAPANLDLESREWALSLAARNLGQLQILIDALEVFSHVMTESVKLTHNAVSLDQLLGEAIEDFSVRYPDRSVDLDCPGDIYIRGDVPLLRLVFANLLTNAKKFSGDESRIRIAGTIEGDAILIAMADEGVGFPIEQAEHIFKREVKLDEMATGTGLGLYVAKVIVEAHGWRIWAESQMGSGATFWISIPAGRVLEAAVQSG
jgi:signal transduction histidine kinase